MDGSRAGLSIALRIFQNIELAPAMPGLFCYMR